MTHKHLRMSLRLIAVLLAVASAPLAAIEPPKITTDAEHNAVYQKGAALISPHIRLLDRSSKLTDAARADLRQGITYMQAVTQYNPRNWAALWIEGKAYQALDDNAAANKAFEAAYKLQPGNADVAREYAQSCLALGRLQEAINATRHAIEIAPEDAGLQANLALAYLIAGKNQDALRAVAASLRMNSSDPITLRLKKVIDDVLSGKRPQPRTIAEIEG